MCVWMCLGRLFGLGVSDWWGRGGRVGRPTGASHSAQPEWGGRGGAGNGGGQQKWPVGPHNTRVEGAATRRRGARGPTRVAAAAAAAPLRLLPPAAATECRHEGWSPPPPRPRSRAQGCTPVVPEQWRRLSRAQGAVTAVGPRRRRGHSQRPPPPTCVEAESLSPRDATRRGAGKGCGDGAARRRTGADDDGDRRGLCDPTQESDPAAALGSRRPCEGHAHPALTAMGVSCC